MEVAPGVLVVGTSTADGKVGVIAGDGLALAVDAGIDDAEGRAVLAAARSLGRAEVWLAYSHGHADHVLGGTAFRGHHIVASPGIGQHMADQVEEWAARTGEPPDELRARLGWPTLLMERGGELDLGRRRVRFLDTPGHAPGTLCVLDPDEGILFGGDTVVTGIPPFFRDGDSGVLERTLRGLAELELQLLVPGHGGLVWGAEAIREAISWEADYLARCRSHVAGRPGADADAVVAAAPYADFIGDHLPRDRHRMEWRHEQTIRLLIAERARAEAEPQAPWC